MNSAPSPKYQKTISLYILSSENKSYTVKFYQAFEKLEITIKNDYLLSYSYKVSLQIEDLHKLNKYFRQFDSIEEILEDLNDIEKLEEKIDITSEDKFVKLIKLRYNLRLKVGLEKILKKINLNIVMMLLDLFLNFYYEDIVLTLFNFLLLQFQVLVKRKKQILKL